MLQVINAVMVTTGSTGIKKVIEANSGIVNVKYSDLIGPPPALAGQLIIFTREVVDMIKVIPGSKIPFYITITLENSAVWLIMALPS